MSQNRAEPVTLAGVAVGLSSLAFGFVQLRPNRLSSGMPFHLWQIGAPIESLVFLVLLVLALAVELVAARRLRGAVLDLIRGIIGNLVVVVVVLAAAVGALHLQPADKPFARISFAPGVWISVLSGYILILAALKRLKGWRRLTVSLLAIAVLVVLAATGVLNDLSLMKEYLARRSRFLEQLSNHITLSLSATGLAALAGVPLGIWAFRRLRAERPIFAVVNTLQTIPSLALFGLLIAPLSLLSHKIPFLRALGIEGIGWAPALIALTLYALLPIARNTYTSLKILDPSLIEAGKGMGMGRRQLLFSIELPLSLPIILGGLRTSLVQAIGNTAVAALIGAGGFGVF
ncbi:MAG TPA: ABC transporter permease, partial [Spirochaetia bacterium]|nr:ABC transporter permease [Spirochaetia bacterium]